MIRYYIITWHQIEIVKLSLFLCTVLHSHGDCFMHLMFPNDRTAVNVGSSMHWKPCLVAWEPKTDPQVDRELKRQKNKI
jgi:hypothetical protein